MRAHAYGRKCIHADAHSCLQISSSAIGAINEDLRTLWVPVVTGTVQGRLLAHAAGERPKTFPVSCAYSRKTCEHASRRTCISARLGPGPAWSRKPLSNFAKTTGALGPPLEQRHRPMGFVPKEGRCRLMKVSMITVANALVPSPKEWSRAHPCAYDAPKHDICAAAPAVPHM